MSYLIIALNVVVGLVYTPFMLRMLGPSEYGLYSLAASVIDYLTLLDLGFATAVIRYTAKFRAEGKIKEQYEMFGMFISLYGVISIVALAVAACLIFNVEWLFGTHMSDGEVSELRIMLILLALNLAFSFPMKIWDGILTAYERFVFLRTLDVIRVIANPVARVILLCMGYKAVAMVVVLTVCNVLVLLADWYYCRKELKTKVRFRRIRWGFLKEVSVYSFWIFLIAMVECVYWSSGQFVLGMYCGATVVGIYSLALQLQLMYKMFSTAISSVFLPKVTAMVVNGSDNREISDLFVRTGRIQFIVLSLALSGFVVFGQDFIRLWAGESYSESYVIALWMFVPTTIPLMQHLGVILLEARNEMKFRSLLLLGFSLVCLALTFPLSKAYGGVGSAIAIAIATVLGQILVMNIYYARRQGLDVLRFWREIGRMAIVPVVLCALTLWLRSAGHFESDSLLTLGISVLVFLLVYLPAFWFGSMNISERRLFSAPLQKFIHPKRN